MGAVAWSSTKASCSGRSILSLSGGVFSAAGAGVKTNLLFFTKDTPTEKIWYYDLSDVKVGKKTPLTLKHVEDFAAKLATRENSDRSWIVDLAARRDQAAKDAQPFRDTARAKSHDAQAVRSRLGELKKTTPRDESAIADTEERLMGLLKEAREATNKADDIENAVYDLKAVNPNRKVDVDRRTPAELLDLIEAKGREVAAAVAALRTLRLMTPRDRREDVSRSEPYSQAVVNVGKTSRSEMSSFPRHGRPAKACALRSHARLKGSRSFETVAGSIITK